MFVVLTCIIRVNPNAIFLAVLEECRYSNHYFKVLGGNALAATAEELGMINRAAIDSVRPL